MTVPEISLHIEIEILPSEVQNNAVHLFNVIYAPDIFPETKRVKILTAQGSPQPLPSHVFPSAHLFEGTMGQESGPTYSCRPELPLDKPIFFAKEEAGIR